MSKRVQFSPEVWRRVYFVICCSLLCLVSVLSWQGKGENASLWKIYSYIGVMVFGFGAWFFFPSRRPFFCNLRTIFLLSVLVRLCFWGMEVSDDVNRYLWEGRLVGEGISPYHQVAMDEFYAKERDGYWELMNHRDRLTAYPPLVMFVFAGISWVDYHYDAMKAAFIFFDLLVVLSLLLLLHKRQLPLRHALLYSLNPIVLFSFAGEAHYDSLFILAMVLALYAWLQRKEGWAWLAIGVAIQIKILAVILVPWMFFRASKKWKVIYAGIAMIVPSLWFYQDIDQLLRGLYNFGAESAFNAPLHGLIRWMTGSIELASYLSYGIFAIAVLLIVRFVRSVELAWCYAWTAFLFCASIIHFWYVAWALPFVLFLPSLAYLWLSGSMALYYLTSYSVDQGGDWSLPIWASIVQWVPFVLLLALHYRHLIGRIRYHQPEQMINHYSVVIPVYKDESALRRCLQALQEQMSPPSKVVVVDAEHDSHSSSVAKDYNADYLIGAAGRGLQIARGLEELENELVLILHADTLLPRSAGRDMMTFMNRNQYLVGGVLGQRFGGGGAGLPFIEGLNDMRITFGGTGFGDQGQFFRQSALKKSGGYPAIKLMEDVALSDRLLQVGSLGLLDCPVISSPRAWVKHGFATRFIQVISCMLRYRWARLRGKDISNELYQFYYGRKK